MRTTKQLPRLSCYLPGVDAVPDVDRGDGKDRGRKCRLVVPNRVGDVIQPSS